MCTAFFAFFTEDNKEESKEETKQETPKFVLFFNRDERINRKAVKWVIMYICFRVERYGDVICGIDVKTDTTWLAINTKTHRVAFLTNFRTKENELEREWMSRGSLVKQWVDLPEDPSSEKDYISSVMTK
jgi:uncharacterized protein with NRDE domain